MKIESIKGPGRFVGRNEMAAHLKGKKLSYKQAVMAKCYDCMSGYPDGAYDCQAFNCPLYPMMPYRGKEGSPASPHPLKPIPPAVPDQKTTNDPLNPPL